MQRRNFLSATIASAAASALARRSSAQAPAAQPPAANPPVRIGVDVYSLQSQNWTPFQSLDFCSKLGVKVVHFSEIRFLGTLEPDNLTKVRDYAKHLNLDVEIGMKSICPTSTMFDASQGSAEQQLGRMIQAATIIGSPIVRCVLGSAAERKGKIPLEGHIENTIKVLKNIRSRATDANVKIAIENHAGDMQARELKTLIEGAGPDFVGVCLDSGNPLWTLESPHLTLETLHPYVLTSHVRDSSVWMTPAGVAVRWRRTGEGNIDIDGYIRKYIELCPGRALSAEIIVTPNPRIFAIHDATFWAPYKTTPAWEYQRFLDLAEKGEPPAGPQASSATQAQRLATQREDLEVSIQYTKKLLAL